jgi:hypothetical protein
MVLYASEKAQGLVMIVLVIVVLLVVIQIQLFVQVLCVRSGGMDSVRLMDVGN